ncbi:ATP-binding protein [Streptomyces jumonjinensis]|uniref:ATP-binding protein n=1 Tax=Streptomyces jumonjinensis TaxID=1945 RepID=A0A646KJY9_STRJU|nr:ATP-binding protein [Streptomyces jumonjinensis]MQT01376.1 ATP-binding protein [Streptomyces jumonjinensis]
MSKAATKPPDMTMSLTAKPSEIGGIRRTVISFLQECGLDSISDDVALVVSELLANVHEHAQGVCDLEIRQEGEKLLVEVSDTVMAPPTLRSGSVSAEAGRGLLLVDALTEHWETTITATGKVITCAFRTS